LLELYSSEGCSSCPPADQWLAALRSHAGLWKTFTPIEFHVDYWNRLGWIDRFSLNAFTARQQAYSIEWQTPSVYTPGFVLGGTEWKQPNAVVLPLPGASSGRPRVGQLKVDQLSPSRYRLRFGPARAGR
jgi:hypothetical protein